LSAKKPKNLVASIHDRLLAIARTRGDNFQYFLMRYALERLLYRLAQSPHADQFILKGALLFQLWTDQPHRPTRDLDLLGHGSPAIPRMETIFREICLQPVEDDGLVFDAGSIRGEQVKENDDYQGTRIRGEAKLGNARIPLQIDIGFGDAVTPAPARIDYPTLLDFPAPSLLAYNRETVAAEKLEAMVILGMANSSMKDFFDLWTLAQEFEFDGEALSQAIAATFKRRETPLPTDEPVALTPEFTADSSKQVQWRAFLKRSGLDVQEPDLNAIVAVLRPFLLPPLRSLVTAQSFRTRWPPAGPWQGK
jgi:predicted nucleotidyltransferase component of viral defense system